MGEEMTILIIAIVLSGTTGAIIMGIFNINSYSKGLDDGEVIGYETGYKEGYNDAGIRYANVIAFPEKEVSK